MTVKSHHLEFHPIANLFPLLDGEEFAALVDDIQQHGQREPIWLYEGMILDGRNRYRACVELGVEPQMQTYEGDDPTAFVVSLNLKRRHLNESQRAMVASNLATMRQGERTDLRPIGRMSQIAAANLLNVGERSVRRAVEVRGRGAPNVIAAVERGEVSVAAAVEAVKTAAKEDQKHWTAADIKRAAKEIALGGIKLPSPAKAIEQSKDTGRYVLASDGKYHIHVSPEDRALGDAYYALTEAIETISELTVEPARAVSLIPDFEEEDIDRQLPVALRWLHEFQEKWNGRKG